MSKPSTHTVRRYGKQHKKPTSERLFVELAQSPIRPAVVESVDEPAQDDDALDDLTNKFTSIDLKDAENTYTPPRKSTAKPRGRRKRQAQPEPECECEPEPEPGPGPEPEGERGPEPEQAKPLPEYTKSFEPSDDTQQAPDTTIHHHDLRVLTWTDVCPPGDKILKIAEASYAEVYRVNNARGTSIIKVIRMTSPIKPQTKAQVKARLVDEEPHSESDVAGELQISEWLADIPGFVVYKERYIVKGKACRELLETHQAFQRRIKRRDPDRLQFYPSPSRYLDETEFLVIELGDAGMPLEDFALVATEQLWDIFFLVAIALARAEAQIEFEHRDLHEGNLCIRQTGEPTPVDERGASSTCFGNSGLDITILDYGLSRARAPSASPGDAEEPLSNGEPVAYDLERDLNIFTSDHAPQCRVYREMRSFLLRGDRVCLPPASHKTPYAAGIDGPINWLVHEPYTNVLWLSYIYQYLVNNFQGSKKDLGAFESTTKELWLYLDPDSAETIPGFASASDIVMYAVQMGWISEEQLMGGARGEIEKSILSVLTEDSITKRLENLDVGETRTPLRRSPRRRRQRPVA